MLFFVVVYLLWTIQTNAQSYYNIYSTDYHPQIKQILDDNKVTEYYNLGLKEIKKLDLSMPKIKALQN
jgi:hypothetical protein